MFISLDGVTAVDLGLPIVRGTPDGSLTDRCNLRCTYCMPAEGLDWLKKDELLTDAELIRLMRIAVVDLGVTDIRFTGGEPLLRRGLEQVIAATAALAAT